MVHVNNNTPRTAVGLSLHVFLMFDFIKLDYLTLNPVELWQIVCCFFCFLDITTCPCTCHVTLLVFFRHIIEPQSSEMWTISESHEDNLRIQYLDVFGWVGSSVKVLFHTNAISRHLIFYNTLHGTYVRLLLLIFVGVFKF